VYVIVWRKQLETGMDRGQQPVRAFAAAAPQRRALSRMKAFLLLRHTCI